MSSKWLDTFRAIDFSEYPHAKMPKMTKLLGPDF